MIIKLISTGREMPCTKNVWESFTQVQKEKFEVIEGEKEVKVLMELRPKNTKKNKNAH